MGTTRNIAPQHLVDSILQSMHNEIERHGLKVLAHYPDDLLVHDRAILARAAVSGAKIAWMVGHSHTHIVQLGLHSKENELVDCLTNLSSEDRFYLVRVGAAFTITELDRADFANLERTPVPYCREGIATNFRLNRGNRLVGHCTATHIGDWQKPVYQAKIAPCGDASDLDVAALQLWSERGIVEAAGTLFVQSEITLVERMPMAA